MVIRSVLGTWLLAITLVVPFVKAWEISKYSPRGRRDLLALTYARVVEMLAVGAGYWNGCREINRLELKKNV
jgi:hypothetical protein